MEIAHGIAQPRRVLDDNDGVFRQIVERSRHFRVDERQILVRRGQRTRFAQTFGIAFEVCLQIRVLLFPAARGERQNGFCQSGRAAFRQRRNRLHARQTAQALALL